MLDEKEQKALLAKGELARPHLRAPSPRARPSRDMAQNQERGWSSNVGESVEDLAAVAPPFQLASEWYAVSIVGPATGRMERRPGTRTSDATDRRRLR